MAYHKPKAEAESYKSNSSNYPSGCGSQVSIEIRETSVNQKPVQSPTSKDEQDKVDTPNFTVSLERLAEVVETNVLGSKDQSSGVQQIASALETNTDSGIIGDEKDLYCRIKAFGLNKDFERQDDPVNKSLKQLVLKAFKDSTIILLLCCATLSLIIDIKRNGPEKGFFDGTIIFLAIFVAVNFGNTCRFFKSRIMLTRLQKQKNFACVVRQGNLQHIPASQLVVGDIVWLETGSQVPADGLFIYGNSCKLDDGLAERVANYSSMFTGAKVVEGHCRMLVTSVGENTERSKLIGSVVGNERKHKESKLQKGIDRLNSRLEKVWLILSLFILTVQLLRCFMSKSADGESHNPDPKGLKNTVEEIVNEATKFMKRQGGKINGLVSMLCILLFATRDGLPLGILVLFFFASKKMKSLEAMVAKFSACATLGLVTTVCLSKTDDLSLDHAEMAELWIGLKCIMDVSKELNGQVLKILQEGICMNSSGGQTEDYSLLYWAQKVLHVHGNELPYRNCTILHDEPFNVDMIHGNSLVLRRTKETQGVLEMHWRGDPEGLLSQCSHYYDADGSMLTLDEEKKAIFSRLIEEIASDDQPCFAFGYKRVIRKEYSTSSKPEEKGHSQDDDNEKTPISLGLTLIGFVRLKNPYPPEIRQTVEDCRAMGVNVKLMVDDNVNVARIMALHFGVLRSEDDVKITVIEGKDFRNSSEEDRMNLIDKISVIANASPADKILMVQCLRKKVEVVATTGSCIRDFPSLIEADVGIFMGENSARMAKEDADIIAGMNICTIAAILRMGRYVCQSIRKFLELHLTLNISAFMINLIFEVSTSEVQLTSFQLLWTNLIVESVGAFALATLMVQMEPTNPQNGPNVGETRNPPPTLYGAGPIITKKMWRNIVVQSLFQVTILMVLGMKGKVIFHVDNDAQKTMIFNSYVLCQVFMMIGAMKKIKKTNFLQGAISIENFLFLSVVGIIVALQILLIEIMGVIAHWGKLDCKRWWICIAIAALSSLLGHAAKRVSDYALPCK